MPTVANEHNHKVQLKLGISICSVGRKRNGQSAILIPSVNLPDVTTRSNSPIIFFEDYILRCRRTA